MRGSVFVEFVDYLEDRFGLEQVDAIVADLGATLSTEGAYTAVGDYPHTEMLAIAQSVCERTDTPLPTLVREFAGFLLDAFARMHPEYFESTDDVFEFLESVGSLIHQDVRKLYPDSNPPMVRLERLDRQSARLTYESHRPLAPLAHALAEATGEKFGQPLAIDVRDAPEDGRRLVLELRVTS